MMVRRGWLVLWLVLVVAGCVTTSQEQGYHAGLLSKQVAEATYQGLYAGYREGRVSQESMDLADRYYDEWRRHQQHYVEAFRRGETPSPEVQRGLEQALMSLVTLASAAKTL